MKYFMLVGGCAASLLTFVAGLGAGKPIDVVLVQAGVACLIGAALMRGVRHLYIRSLRTVVVQRAKQHAAAAQVANSTQAA